MSRSLLLLIFVGLAGCWNVGAGSGSLSNPRLPLEPPVVGYGLEELPGLQFNNPVVLTSPPGETNRLFVVERAGRILVVTNLAQPDLNVFLDLRQDVFSADLESGLLGMAFHPGYATNRQFFLFRTLLTTTEGITNLFHNQLSRFETSPEDPNRALAESELPLITQADDDFAHNAGDLHFGPDGYLYVALGDSGPKPRDATPGPQSIEGGFFGAILRIDVDHRPGNLPPNPHPASSQNYAIPADNPFVGATQFAGRVVDPLKVRTEFFAVGFRNPWRMSFDPFTGDLLSGDVGSGFFEEINLVQKGGNYGWPLGEGWPEHFENTGLQRPLYFYEHGYRADQGKCVIGGMVYSGHQIPQLRGAYVFGDHTSGHIWVLRRSGELLSVARLTTWPGISAFGMDPASGELLVANHNEGRIQRLIYVPPELATPLPASLAATGAFLDLLTLEPSPAFQPYDINVPFWSDHAIKQRWFALPEGQTIDFDARENWNFPPGSVWMKHFDLEMTEGIPASRRRLETRFLVKNETSAYGITYRWDEDGKNAWLVPDEGHDETLAIRNAEGTVRLQNWRYPSWTECMFCHTKAGGIALGFNTAQLNRPGPGGAHQLEELERAGYLSQPLPELTTLPSLSPADDLSQPLTHRVRSYLAANCAQCHQPSGPAGVLWDARAHVPLAGAGLMNGRLLYRATAPADRVVVPGDLDHSLLLRLIAYRGPGQMPPHGSFEIDQSGVALLSEWIQNLPQAPWTAADVGGPSSEGSSSVAPGEIVVSGSGLGLGDGNDSFHWLSQLLPSHGEVVVRIGHRPSQTSAQAGLMLRSSNAPDAPFAALLAGGDGRIPFAIRQQHGGEVRILGIAPEGQWLRLVRESGTISAYTSADGATWTHLATEAVDFSPTILTGLFTSSREPSALATARFTDFQIAHAAVGSPDLAWTAPASVHLGIEAFPGEDAIRHVRFFLNEENVQSVSTAPFTTVLTGVAAGSHVLSAEITTAGGTIFRARPLSLEVAMPPTIGTRQSSGANPGGNWIGRYGELGYALPASALALPAEVTFESSANWFVWDDETDAERALEHPDQPGRHATCWFDSPTLEFDLHLNSGALYQLTLYFLDWDSEDRRVQTIELLDRESGRLLDRQEIGTFSKGTFLAWSVRGSLRIRITATGAGNAVLSGLFLDADGNDPPVVRWISPAASEIFDLPTPILLSVEAEDPDGQVASVEFFQNGMLLGRTFTPPWAFVWDNPVTGAHDLSAAAIDDRGERSERSGVSIQVRPAPARARFLAVDETTQGNWKGNYGGEGVWILHEATNSPPYVSVQLNADHDLIWDAFALDPAALERMEPPWRIAPVWFSPERIQLRLDFLDGQDHQVSLYFLEWNGRDAYRLLLEVWDANTLELLDSREIDRLNAGKYLTWLMRGSVDVQIHRITANSILSGIFFDRSPLQEDQSLLRILAGSDGTFQLLMLGSAGRLYALEESTDLHTWNRVARGTVAYNNLIDFGQWPAPPDGFRFFRTRLLSASDSESGTGLE